MIVASVNANQVVTPNQKVIFNQLRWKSGCAESFRNPGSSILIANGIFEVSFSGNVSGAAAGTPVQIAISADGSALLETTMISTPAAAGDFNNVSASTIIGTQNQCCCNSPSFGSLSIEVTNTGTVDVTIAANSSIRIKRIG